LNGRGIVYVIARAKDVEGRGRIWVRQCGNNGGARQIVEAFVFNIGLAEEEGSLQFPSAGKVQINAPNSAIKVRVDFIDARAGFRHAIAEKHAGAEGVEGVGRRHRNIFDIAFNRSG
jgi:hypothetical protein